LQQDPDFVSQVRELIQLRKQTPLVRLAQYLHGSLETGSGTLEISWLTPDGEPKADEAWEDGRAFCMLISESGTGGKMSVAILVNGTDTPCEFILPSLGEWRLAFSTSDSERPATTLGALSIALLLCDGV
jgi:pullulanase/glycogen debranching enzyme